jgi:AraC-like DNA-binding protein
MTQEWLSAFYRTSHVPVWLVEGNDEIYANCMGPVAAGSPLGAQVLLLTQNASREVRVRLEGYAEIYAMFSFTNGENLLKALVGPALIASGESVKRNLSIAQYLPGETAEEFIFSLPSIRALAFPDIVALVYLTLTGEPCDTDALYREFFKKERAKQKIAEETDEPKPRIGYRKELEMLLMIKNGDARTLRQVIMSLRGRSTGYLSKDLFRQRLYEFICMVALDTRFAIEGGLNEETAYELSDSFIRQADECGTITRLEQLTYRMVDTFAHLVAESRTDASYSAYVKKAAHYIRAHCRDKITLNDLARHCNLSPRYLCTLFEEETGKRVHAFIVEQKINEAKNLLRFSDISYADIATALSFSSQSHFAAVFKRETLLTPRQYRSSRTDTYWP